MIGAKGDKVGYMRPETAQGILYYSNVLKDSLEENFRLELFNLEKHIEMKFHLDRELFV